MLLVDVLLVIAIIGFAGAGWKDGFVQTFGRLVGAVLGFIAARAWSVYLTGILALFMPVGIAHLIAFLIIFVFITRLIGFIFKLAEAFFKILSVIPFLKTINAFLGAIVGLAEGIIILGGAIYLILAYNLEPHLVTWLSGSGVAHWINNTFHTLLGFLL